LSAPSGYALDILQPLSRLACLRPQWLEAVHLVASDLDPEEDIARELVQATQSLGADFRFVKGDLTSIPIRMELRRFGPYDIVLFIGLSTWLPKPHLLHHLNFIRRFLLASGGTLFTDCFTPQAFALTGHYAGFPANYYAPRDYASLLAYCGFPHEGMSWQSGPENINHVCIARTTMNAK
jgi:hypothetical protein